MEAIQQIIGFKAEITENPTFPVKQQVSFQSLVPSLPILFYPLINFCAFDTAKINLSLPEIRRSRIAQPTERQTRRYRPRPLNPHCHCQDDHKSSVRPAAASIFGTPHWPSFYLCSHCSAGGTNVRNSIFRFSSKYTAIRLVCRKVLKMM